MTRVIRPTLLVCILASTAITRTSVQAQITQTIPATSAATPVTVPEGSRPRVFISNAVTAPDRPVSSGVSVTGGPGQAFNKFYAAVESSGQYQLVSAPAVADYVFEFHYSAYVDERTDWVKRDPYNKKKFPPETEKVEYLVPVPKLGLVIFEPRTHGVYGGFTEAIKLGHKQEEREEILSSAIKFLVSRAGSLLGRSPVSGDVPHYAGDPPAPSQIKSATTVFISNSGSSPSTYNRFYALMKSWGGYQLSPNTDGADLIFEVADSWLQVAILDPETGVTLWSFNPDVGEAILKQNTEKNVARGLTSIVRDIARMAGRPAPVSFTPPGANAASAVDAPTTAQLISAKTVFISNAGIEPLLDLKDKPLEIYNTFCATIQNWGRFKLVSTPAEADLVFRITVPSEKPNLFVEILDPQTATRFGGPLRQEVHGTLHGTVSEQKDMDKAIAALVTKIATRVGARDAQVSVPPSIPAAAPPISPGLRRIFVSRSPYPNDYYEKSDGDQLYTKLSAEVGSWDHYKMTPARDADLILEPSVRSGRVQVTIRDPKTRCALWTVVRPIQSGFFNHNAFKNYMVAVDLVVRDLRQLASVASPETKKSAASR